MMYDVRGKREEGADRLRELPASFYDIEIDANSF
jgi:hypothetical protein